jgi:dTDP-4-dehydrorhamnose reductase
MKILVSGANGQVGKCIRDMALSFPEADCLFLGRDHFAIDRFEMVENVLESIRPEWVINAAAYTAVDKAENEKEAAFLINGEAVGHLARACRRQNISLLHLSTDYVFDGLATEPYPEDAPTNPQGVYGASKLLGESLIRESGANAIILRTSWVYSRHGYNFVKTMIRLMKEKEQLKVVNDQTGSPTYAIDLAEVCLRICLAPKQPTGIFHYSNHGAISWFDFACAIRDLVQASCMVLPIPTSGYPTPARRPPYSVLHTAKIEKTFGIETKSWRPRLEACLQAIRDSSV